MTGFPSTWRVARVEDLAKVQGGIQKQQTRRPVHNKYPFLRVANVGRGRLNLKEIHEVELFDGELTRLALQAGDLLIVEGNGSPDEVGRAATWRGEIENCVHQNHLIRLRPSDALLPDFLEVLWNSPSVRRQLRQVANSTSGLYTLSTGKINKIVLPVPPLEEQHRIIDALGRANELRTKRRATIALLNHLAQSIFTSLVGDVIENDRGWNEGRTLGDVAEVVSGITKGRKLPAGTMRTVPYLAVANVQAMRLEMAEIKTIDATETEIERYALKRNDLVLTEGGDPDKLGRGTLWRDELSECIHQNHIFRVRLHPDSEIVPLYLNWLIASERGRRYFLKSAKQTTGIASINATQLRQFPLLEPPPSLQRNLADQLVQVDAVKRTHVAHLADLDVLFESVQDRAFRGELFPDDSPDSVLTDR